MSISGAFEQFVRSVHAYIGAQRPERITINYPPGSPFAGVPAGDLIREDHAGGAGEYTFRPLELVPSLAKAVSDHVAKHHFGDLGSFAQYVVSREGWGVFVEADRFRPAHLRSLNEVHPEQGSVQATIDRHPAFLRWSGRAGTGRAVDLTHVELADLLIDNQEDLAEPVVAQIIKQFRAAKSVEYDADLDGVGAIGLRTTWKGGNTAELQLPREFAASFPAYSGAWAPGEEPKHEARFTLRLVPPKGESPAPTFRVLWVNAFDFELEAAAALLARVREVHANTEVFLGTPDATRYVLPDLEADS